MAKDDLERLRKQLQQETKSHAERVHTLQNEIADIQVCVLIDSFVLIKGCRVVCKKI